MKYFVIGGAGFIGSSLVKQLLKDNKPVTVYDDLSSGKFEYIKECTSNKYFKFIKGDIMDFNKLCKAMKGQQFVYHLAANPEVRLGEKDTRIDFQINTIGTLNVLDSIVKNKIKKLAFTSSSAVFGIPSIIPTPEDYGPSLPESFYGASKLASEGFISVYAKIFKIKTWIFKLANITGEPLTHGIIFDFIKKINKNPKELEVLGDGNQEKSYVTNRMLVDAMQYVIKKTMKNKESVLLYNIGNDDKIKVKKIAELFIKTNKLSSKLKYTGGKVGWKGDVPLMQLSIKKIKKIGWKPSKSSEECVLESIKNNLINKESTKSQ